MLRRRKCRPTSRPLLVLSLLIPLLVAGVRPTQAGPAEIYVYRERGRPVYVNGLDRVPEAYRGRATRLDLSQVSLNPELGRELSEQLAREVTRLAANREKAGDANSCSTAAPAAGIGGWWSWAWQHHGYLILLGGLALLLLAASPFVARRLGTARWLRILMIVLPLLGFLGVVTYAVAQTSSALRSARSCEQLQQTMPLLEQLERTGGVQVQPVRD